jgi:hypothetical protein
MTKDKCKSQYRIFCETFNFIFLTTTKPFITLSCTCRKMENTRRRNAPLCRLGVLGRTWQEMEKVLVDPAIQICLRKTRSTDVFCLTSVQVQYCFSGQSEGIRLYFPAQTFKKVKERFCTKIHHERFIMRKNSSESTLCALASLTTNLYYFYLFEILY